MGQMMTYLLFANMGFNTTILVYAEFNYLKLEYKRKRHKSKVEKALQMQRLYREQVAWYQQYRPQILEPPQHLL